MKMKKTTAQNRKKKQKNQRKKTESLLSFIRWRFRLSEILVAIAFIGLVARISYIEVIKPDRLLAEGNNRSLRIKSIASTRGIISDRNGQQLAVSVPARAVIADPVTIFKNNGLQDLKPWYALADVLGLDRATLLNRIKKYKKKRFIYIQRQVRPVMADYIEKLKLPGISLKNESRRFYPSGEISSHIVGVTGIDGHGLEGIERTYDGWLTGEPGRKTVRKDRYGRVVENIALKKRQPGKPLVLSIDQRIQATAYRAVKQAVMDNNAVSASAILVDVKTGEILAMVNAPSYNPNNRDQLQTYRMRNRAITDAIEPGSTVKPFVVLAALENKVVTPSTMVNTGNGVFRLGGRRVRDHRGLGKISLTTILQKSSNVGVSKLSLAMPIQDLLGVYRSVGIGDYSGINLIGEASGFFPTRTRWSDFERATIAFGYGVAVTPIQLVHAYATLGAKGIRRPLSLLKTEKVVPGTQVVSKGSKNRDITCCYCRWLR